jgi:thiamine kinase-like enzyme
MSNYIITKTIEKTKINENGRIFKPWTEDEKNQTDFVKGHLEILDILAAYDFDFFPNILAWDEKGYSYEYVEGEVLNDYAKRNKITMKFIYELKIAMDKIHEELYHASMEIWNGKRWLYHCDLWLGNLIWNDELKELKIIDINAIGGNALPYLGSGINFWLLQLEQILLERSLNKNYEY